MTRFPSPPSTVKASKNGHMTPQPPRPSRLPKRSPRKTVPRKMSFSPTPPEVLSHDEGPAVPGEAMAVRPDHPMLGGALYTGTPPLRFSRYPRGLTEATYKCLEENHPLTTTELRLAEDAARHAAQRVHETGKALHQALRAKQQKAQEARRQRPLQILHLRKKAEEAVQRERNALEFLEKDIARVQSLSLGAHSLPGVPQASTLRRSIDELSNWGGGIQEEVTIVPTSPGGFSPGQIKLAKIALGVSLGLLFGVNLRFYSIASLKRLNGETLLLALFWMGAGAGMMVLLSEGMPLLWQGAGEKAVENEACPELVGWKRIRHAALPAGVTGSILFMEAAIIRNAQVSSPTVTDPLNPLYLIGGFGLILSATLYGAVLGWRQGYGSRRHLLRNERGRQESLTSHEALETLVRNSADAQHAMALDHHLEMLLENREELLIRINTLQAPFEVLLEEEPSSFSAPTELSEEDRKRWAQTEEDAGAAARFYTRKLAEIRESLEPSPSVKRSLALLLYRNAENLPVPKPRRSLWKRFSDWWNRRTEPTESSQPEGAL